MALKVVVIGTGFGRFPVAPAYKDLGCEVELVSPREDEALRAAIEAPCDLVSIHSPPFLHLEHVKLATSHGRNVLCEKPFDRNAARAREMLELVRSAVVLHFVNFEFRGDPLREKLKQLLDDGVIGEPMHVAWTTFTSVGRDLPHSWMFEQGKGGWIGEFGSHVVDFLRWLFGEVAAAGGQARTEVKTRPDRDTASGKVHPCTAEDAFTAWFRMENGVTATLDTAFCASVNLAPHITVFGSKGALQIDGMSDLLVIRPGQETERYVDPPDMTNPHQPSLGRWFSRLCGAIREGRQITPDFSSGLACTQVLDALRAVAAD